MGFFTHHVGFGCFVSLFPYYGTHTYLVFFPQTLRQLSIVNKHGTTYNNDRKRSRVPSRLG